jgi:hypothetical protein
MDFRVAGVDKLRGESKCGHGEIKSNRHAVKRIKDSKLRYQKRW